MKDCMNQSSDEETERERQREADGNERQRAGTVHKQKLTTEIYCMFFGN